MKKWEFSFYVDIISILPPVNFNDVYFIVIHIGIGRVLKLFTKVRQTTGFCVNPELSCTVILTQLTRYFDYLDETNPSAVFCLRLAKTLLLFGINAWLAACILFYLACDPPSNDGYFYLLGKQCIGFLILISTLKKFRTQRNCTGFNWLNSWYIRTLTEQDDLMSAYESETLANRNPFLLACHFTIATISSAGFGDFGPHTLAEMAWITLLQLYGFFLVGYFTAKLTSALSCIYLPK